MIESKVLYSESSIGTQILLTSGNESLLADVGDGALRDLASIHFEFETLGAILVTHEHSDHVGGLFSLLGFMKHLPRNRPLRICAPRPVRYLDRFFSKPLMQTPLPFAVELVAMEDGSRLRIGPFEVRAFRSDHVDYDSIGYTIVDPAGYRVVISGDTRACPALRKAAKGADLAILESTFEDGQEEFAREYGHMTVGQAKEVGSLAKKATYVHRMPQEYFSKMTCAKLPTVGA